MTPLALDYITFTQYDKTYKNVSVLFKEQDLINTMGEVLEQNQKRQLRVAETEKYPHVTFFFSGGRENPFIGEERILAPSPKVATYDLQPSMSAEELTVQTIDYIQNKGTDFLVINYANPDMVGHTGVFSAVVEGIEKVDDCISRLIPVLQTQGFDILICADHGNAEFMVNPDGTPNTAHTTNLVPVILISQNTSLQIKDGKLADVCPTLLYLMDIVAPKEMDGEVLVG
jgi:2,3-bisphosphoglycerate-independent phosphoglycerate mutase